MKGDAMKLRFTCLYKNGSVYVEKGKHGFLLHKDCNGDFYYFGCHKDNFGDFVYNETPTFLNEAETRCAKAACLIGG